VARQRRRYERPWVRDHVKINRKFILSVRTLQDNFDKFTLTLMFMSIFQAIHLIYEALFILLTNGKRR
jgi:hypothetical protein